MTLYPYFINRSGVCRERRVACVWPRHGGSDGDGHKEAPKGTKSMNSFLCFFAPSRGRVPGALGPKFLRISLRRAARKERCA